MTPGKTYWCNTTGGVSGYTNPGNASYNGYPVFHCVNYWFTYGDTVTIVQKVYAYPEGSLTGSPLLFYKTSAGMYILSLVEDCFTEAKIGEIV